MLLCPDNDQTKIIWALSYMKSGRAAKWAACVFKWEEDNEEYTRFLDWDNFKLEFCKEFCPTHSNSTTINKLESTSYYQKTRSVDDYLDEFLDLIAESRYTDPKTLVVKFRRGLDLQIQNVVATMMNRWPSDIAPTAWYEGARNETRTGLLMKLFALLTISLPTSQIHSAPLLNPLSNPPQLKHMSNQLWVTQYLWT